MHRIFIQQLMKMVVNISEQTIRQVLYVQANKIRLTEKGEGLKKFFQILK